MCTIKDSMTDADYVIVGYINEVYQHHPIVAEINDDGAIIARLPEKIDDVSSFVLDIGNKFGATCDLKMVENEAALVLWHDYAVVSPAPRPAGKGCNMLSVMMIGLVLGIVCFCIFWVME